MSVLPISGLDYLGGMPNQTTLVPNRSYPAKEAGNRKYIIPSKPMAPKLLNNAIQPSTLRKVLGKSNFNSIIVVRSQPAPSTDGMFPKQGIARHQKRGLAYEDIPGKKIDGPLMPLADSNFAFLNSKLGQPK
jgi:hypothetical protein